MSTTNITLQGDLTVHSVAKHKQTFLDAFDQNPKEIRISWGTIERADVAGIQLLHSVFLLAKKKSVDLQVDRPLPGSIAETLEDGGFGYLNWARG